jgi:hypothetical protein
MRRFSESSAKVKPVEEGSEEWETGAQLVISEIHSQISHPFSAMHHEFNFHSCVITSPFLG